MDLELKDRKAIPVGAIGRMWRRGHAETPSGSANFGEGSDAG